MGGFYRMGPANGALDASAGNDLRNRSSERKIGCEAPVTGGNRNQPARAVNKRSHGGSSDLDSCVDRNFQIVRRAAYVNLVGARRAIAKGNILGHVVVEVGRS